MSNSATQWSRRALRRVVTMSRAGEWWGYKLVLVVTVFYATASYLRVPIAALWSAVLALLGSVLAGAAYVSVLNDWTDRREDAAAGKMNRLADAPTWQAAGAIALCLLIGLGFGWSWRDSRPLLLAYGGAWLAFSLYSLPPVRLKARGLAGMLADASGAHMLPALVAALLVFRAVGVRPDGRWLTTAALWAGAYGLRGILWHQLADRDNDDAAGVRTFAQRHSRVRLVAFARWCVFPVEVSALAVLLWLIGEPLPVFALAAYLLLVWRKVARWNMAAVLVEVQPRYLILMADYYQVFLPLALLLASTLRLSEDLWVLVAHLLLFRSRTLTVLEESWRLRHTLRRSAGGARQSR